MPVINIGKKHKKSAKNVLPVARPVPFERVLEMYGTKLELLSQDQLLKTTAMAAQEIRGSTNNDYYANAEASFIRDIAKICGKLALPSNILRDLALISDVDVSTSEAAITNKARTYKALLQQRAVADLALAIHSNHNPFTLTLWVRLHQTLAELDSSFNTRSDNSFYRANEQKLQRIIACRILGYFMVLENKLSGDDRAGNEARDIRDMLSLISSLIGATSATKFAAILTQFTPTPSQKCTSLHETLIRPILDDLIGMKDVFLQAETNGKRGAFNGFRNSLITITNHVNGRVKAELKAKAALQTVAEFQRVQKNEDDTLAGEIAAQKQSVRSLPSRVHQALFCSFRKTPHDDAPAQQAAPAQVAM